jgi:hypothetical protein
VLAVASLAPEAIAAISTEDAKTVVAPEISEALEKVAPPAAVAAGPGHTPVGAVLRWKRRAANFLYSFGNVAKKLLANAASKFIVDGLNHIFSKMVELFPSIFSWLIEHIAHFHLPM